jgi:hypothetical protein
MHNYTALKIEEIRTRYNKEREEEWNKLAESVAAKGLTHSTFHIDSFLDTGYKYIETLLDKLFNVEKTTLLHEKSMPPEKEFDVLKDSISDLLKKELDVIRSHAIKRFQRSGGGVLDIVIRKIENQKNVFQKSISRRVGMLQEELKLKISKPSSGSTIHTREDVSIINTEQIYSSIQIKLDKLKDSNQKILVEGLKVLTNAINSSEIVDDMKREQMENVEFLVSQFEIPPEKRNRGVIKASESFLSNSSNITTIWRQVGPTILDGLM